MRLMSKILNYPFKPNGIHPNRIGARLLAANMLYTVQLTPHRSRNDWLNAAAERPVSGALLYLAKKAAHIGNPPCCSIQASPTSKFPITVLISCVSTKHKGRRLHGGVNQPN